MVLDQLKQLQVLVLEPIPLLVQMAFLEVNLPILVFLLILHLLVWILLLGLHHRFSLVQVACLVQILLIIRHRLHLYLINQLINQQVFIISIYWLLFKLIFNYVLNKAFNNAAKPGGLFGNGTQATGLFGSSNTGSFGSGSTSFFGNNQQSSGIGLFGK